MDGRITSTLVFKPRSSICNLVSLKPSRLITNLYPGPVGGKDCLEGCALEEVRGIRSYSELFALAKVTRFLENCL